MEFSGIRSNFKKPEFYEHYTAKQGEVDRDQAIEVVAGNVALLGQILHDPEDATQDDQVATQARAAMTSGLEALSAGTVALEASKTDYFAVM